MKAAVIANGNKCLFDPDGYDLIICADGALNWAKHHHIPVNTVVGDMDSVEQDLLEGLEIIRVKAEKDETDAFLAMELAAREAEEIHFYGALGGRLDHLLANVGLLARYAEQGLRVMLMDTYARAFVARGEIVLEGEIGQELSLIPVCGEVMIRRTAGLKYPVFERKLTVQTPYFISNVFTDNRALVETDGPVVVILPLAERKEIFE